jgi:hypothetical protein
MLDEKDVPITGIIELRSMYSKERKVHATPVFDTKTRWYKGVPRLSDRKKEELEFWTDEHSKMTVTHGTPLNMANVEDRAAWAWLQHCPAIASSFEAAQMQKDALFYVYDGDILAEKSVNEDDRMLHAMTLIRNDRDDMLESRVRVLGFNMEGDSPNTIRKFLNDRAKKPATVATIIAVYESNSMAIRLLFLRAVDYNLIENKNGVFMYGSTPLGSSDSASIKTLSAQENREMILLLEKELSKIVNVTTEEVEEKPVTRKRSPNKKAPVIEGKEEKGSIPAIPVPKIPVV